MLVIDINGFAIIPDLRQTGKTKNLATFGQKFSVYFSLSPVNLFAKSNYISTSFGFSKIALQNYRENIEKGL